MTNNFSEFKQSVDRLMETSIAKPIEIYGFKPIFWCDNYFSEVSDCCFNHWIGLPIKDGIKHPIYEYEMRAINLIEEHRKIWIKKATGLGISELFLRWGEFKPLIDEEFTDSQEIILTGPNRDLAKQLIARMKVHLKDKINVEGDAYTLPLNKTEIHAFPSMNIDAARAQPNPKFIMGDEAAFFIMVKDDDARAVGERYIAKSNPYMAWISTPFVPEGFFYTIEAENPCVYHKLFLHYEEGLKKHPQSGTSMYSERDILDAQKSPSFPREYGLEWGFGIGNIFDLKALDEISRESYSLAKSADSSTVMAVDPGYGSSFFAILISEMRNGIIYVLVAQQFDRPSQTEMLNQINSYLQNYNISNLLIDASAPELIKEYHERVNTIGVDFKEKGLAMTDDASKKVAEKGVRINPQFTELLSQMRSARKNERGTVDKKILKFDLGDTFLMTLNYHKSGTGILIKI